MSSILIQNGRLIFRDHIQEGSLLIENDKISAISFTGDIKVPKNVEIIDAKGLYVGPGMVDIHCHGAAGHDFIDADNSGNGKALQHHLNAGTTSLVCTFITHQADQMAAATAALAQGRKDLPASYAGIHFEGPYLSPEKPGMHRKDWMHDPDPKEYQKWIELGQGDVRIFTFAPERKGSLEFCKFLKDKGVIVSSGHSQADIDVYKLAMAYGLEHFVHANNAMDWPVRKKNRDGWNQTHPNTVGSMLACDAFTTEIIADGYHVHPELIRLILAVKGSDRVALVSDASPLLGKPEGNYEVAGTKVVLKPGRLCLVADGSALASSISTVWDMVQNMVQRWGFGLVESWKMASWTPARIARLEDRGRLEVGCRADVILANSDLSLKKVICAGISAT